MWRPLGCADSERFALVWESEELKALNNTLFSFVKNKVLLGFTHLHLSSLRLLAALCFGQGCLSEKLVGSAGHEEPVARHVVVSCHCVLDVNLDPKKCRLCDFVAALTRVSLTGIVEQFVRQPPDSSKQYYAIM